MTRRIRQRGKDGEFSYYTEKKSLTGLAHLETESKISEKEYLRLLPEGEKMLRQKRYCFLSDNQYFELDIYSQWKDKSVLENELTKETQQPVLLPWVKAIADVTQDVSYSNVSLVAQFSKAGRARE